MAFEHVEEYIKDALGHEKVSLEDALSIMIGVMEDQPITELVVENQKEFSTYLRKIVTSIKIVANKYEAELKAGPRYSSLEKNIRFLTEWEKGFETDIESLTQTWQDELDQAVNEVETSCLSDDDAFFACLATKNKLEACYTDSQNYLSTAERFLQDQKSIQDAFIREKGDELDQKIKSLALDLLRLE